MHKAGQKIRAWREAHVPPLSAGEFGERYGAPAPWPSRTVYGWEAKGKIPRAAAQRRLAELGICRPEDWLLPADGPAAGPARASAAHPFFDMHTPRLRPRRHQHAASAHRRRLLQSRRRSSRRRGAPTPRMSTCVVYPELCVSSYAIDDLHHAVGAARRGRGGGRRDRRRQRGPLAGAADRRAAAAQRPALQLRAGRSPTAGCSARCPRATCPTTASSTRSAGSPRASTSRGQYDPRRRRRSAVRRRPGLRLQPASPASSSRSRSARTSGRPTRPRPPARSPGRRSSPTSRPRTSSSARPTSATCCAARSRRAPPAPTSIRPPGHGESTTDLAWDGQGMIYELGDLLAESERFALHAELAIADIDTDRILGDRHAAADLQRRRRSRRAARGPLPHRRASTTRPRQATSAWSARSAASRSSPTGPTSSTPTASRRSTSRSTA